MDLMSHLPKDSKQYAYGALAGAFFIAWMGFGNFGWLLPSQANTLAKKQADIAVTNAYAGICSAQYAKAPDYPVRIAALEKVDRWSRGDNITKAGYAVIPGVKETSRDVAQACAELLIPDKLAQTK